MVGVGPVAIRVSKIRYRYQRQHERVWSDGSLFGREYITQGLEPRREYILLPYRVNIYYCPIGWIYITVQWWAEYIEPFRISKYTQPITFLQCVSNYHIVYIFWPFGERSKRIVLWHACPLSRETSPWAFHQFKKLLGNETLERSDLTSEYFVVPKKLRDEPLFLFWFYDLTWNFSQTHTFWPQKS